MTLQEINKGKNDFCGPAVLSSITGISTDEAEKVINTVRGSKSLDRRVTGVWQHELNSAFEYLGWNVYHIPNVANKSIYFLMMTMSEVGVYLFYLPSHVIAIEIAADGKRYIVDNHTKRPLGLSNSARLGQKVLAVVKVEKKNG